jgi:hypothetical protein
VLASIASKNYVPAEVIEKLAFCEIVQLGLGIGCANAAVAQTTPKKDSKVFFMLLFFLIDL